MSDGEYNTKKFIDIMNEVIHICGWNESRPGECFGIVVRDLTNKEFPDIDPDDKREYPYDEDIIVARRYLKRYRQRRTMLEKEALKHKHRWVYSHVSEFWDSDWGPQNDYYYKCKCGAVEIRESKGRK